MCVLSFSPIGLVLMYAFSVVDHEGNESTGRRVHLPGLRSKDSRQVRS